MGGEDRGERESGMAVLLFLSLSLSPPPEPPPPLDGLASTGVVDGSMTVVR